jgi:hypothetical protein
MPSHFIRASLQHGVRWFKPAFPFSRFVRRTWNPRLKPRHVSRLTPKSTISLTDGSWTNAEQTRQTNLTASFADCTDNKKKTSAASTVQFILHFDFYFSPRCRLSQRVCFPLSALLPDIPPRHLRLGATGNARTIDQVRPVTEMRNKPVRLMSIAQYALIHP